MRTATVADPLFVLTQKKPLATALSIHIGWVTPGITYVTVHSDRSQGIGKNDRPGSISATFFEVAEKKTYGGFLK